MDSERHSFRPDAAAEGVQRGPGRGRLSDPGQSGSNGPQPQTIGGRGYPRRQEAFRPNPKAKLLDQCREVLRFHHFALRTEQSYVQWIRRFIVFHGKRHPKDMGKAEINAFLSQLATGGQVAASTQNQALHALLFLYQDVLGTDPGWLDDFVRAKRPERLPRC